MKIPQENVWICDMSSMLLNSVEGLEAVFEDIPSPALASHLPSFEKVRALTHELCLDNFLIAQRQTACNWRNYIHAR